MRWALPDYRALFIILTLSETKVLYIDKTEVKRVLFDELGARVRPKQLITSLPP